MQDFIVFDLDVRNVRVSDSAGVGGLSAAFGKKRGAESMPADSYNFSVFKMVILLIGFSSILS